MYSDKFLKAFERLMYSEGGYVNDPDDPGGETKYGISKHSYPKLDIKNLTRDQVQKIYYVDFWMRAQCEKINDDDVAAKLLNIVVHTGIPQGVRLLQRALCAVGENLTEDGIIGPLTLAAANGAARACLLVALRCETAGYYRAVMRANPALQRFAQGWLARAYS